MGRLLMKIKTKALETGLGKKLRNAKVKAAFTAEIAKEWAKKGYSGKYNSDRINEIAKDMLHEAKYHTVGFDEYIMYHFDEKTEEERREFIPTRERAEFCELMNDPSNQIVFDDKGETYRVFKKFYNRDLSEVLHFSKKEKQLFEEFIKKHPRFIIKPFNGGNGRGISILESGKYGSFDAFWSFLKEQYKGGFVAEELIVQSDELGQFHVESVNTLRIATIRTPNRVYIIHPTWRVGRGNSVVDNGGSGGIFCGLDESGTIVSTCDEKGNQYIIHPDSQLSLIGFTIPHFEEAKKLALELADVVPSNNYCGWDLALTNNGWIMQEGNWQGGFVPWQSTAQKGFRSELMVLLKEMGKIK